MELNNINIEERMRHYNVSGLSLALIDDAKIATTRYYGVLEAGTSYFVDSHSVFNACSISKFMTSMLVMKLTEQGTLDLDEDINKKLTSWKIPESEFTKDTKVTLRGLLSHQSGIVDPEDSFTELNTNEGFPSMVDLLEGRTNYCTVPIEVKYEPGTNFQYSDAGFCVIQQVIEDVTGKPMKKVMNELIFEPLGMKDSTLEMTLLEANTRRYSCGHNKNGEVVDGKYPIYPYPAACGLWTTPSDLAVVVIEFMNALQGTSKVGVSPSKAREMISSQGCKRWAGLGVFLDGSNREIEISSLGWGVGFQCMMVAVPHLKYGLVVMTNTDLGVHQLNGLIGEIYNEFHDYVIAHKGHYNGL